ncbi:head-tail connector protein [Limimaricola cinnabarinus]|uniref:head-tail connector protein n=1 Tax=Limimaricola cinnabarinus TaxID=1125964 RepID=UPI002FE08B2A
MKMLAHRTPISGALPVSLDAVKAHLRVDGSDDDAAIINIAHAAAAELEQFAQIALLNQTIRVTIFQPDPSGYFFLPIGPAKDDSATTVSIDGEPFTDFEFLGGNRPSIRWLGGFHDMRPDRITIEYQAGFGAEATAIPHDIAQAVMDQAALHFDGRSPMDPKMLATSPHMARVGARYRGVQI